MNFEDLKNPELQERLKAAKTIEELAAIAAAEGVDLSDEELKAISGGRCRIYCNGYCPENTCSDND